MKVGTKVRVKKVEPVFNCGIKVLDEEMKRIWRETPIYQRCRENISKSGVITNIQDNYVFVEWTGEEGKGTWTPIECLEELIYLNCRVVCLKNGLDVTKGKIYEVKDGLFMDNTGVARPWVGGLFPVKTIEELNKVISSSEFMQIAE
jgi:hypothetical protein